MPARSPLALAALAAVAAAAAVLAVAAAADGGSRAGVGALNQQGACAAGSTACDVCPGIFPTQCCKSNQVCFQKYGCLTSGYVSCQGATDCMVRSVSCPCPGGAINCDAAAVCCGSGCCNGATPVVGDPVPSVTPSASPKAGAATTAPSTATATTAKNASATTAAANATTAGVGKNASANTTTTSSSNSSTCVDAAWLAAVVGPNAAAHLVHAEPITTAVLCPVASSLPCATPKHIVEVAGEHLSYKQLCAVVDCEADVIPVNAVYTHRWNAIYKPTVGDLVLPGGKTASMTMYSDVCHYRLQVVGHWILEAVHKLRRFAAIEPFASA